MAIVRAEGGVVSVKEYDCIVFVRDVGFGWLF